MKTLMKDNKSKEYNVLYDGKHYSVEICEKDNPAREEIIAKFFSFDNAWEYFLWKTEDEIMLYDWLEGFSTSEDAAKAVKKDTDNVYLKALTIIWNADYKTDLLTADLITKDMFDFLTNRFFS